jgi:uncharacterized membrane protein
VVVTSPLTALIGAQWLLLSMAGGLCPPAVVLRAVGFGAATSIMAAVALDRASGLGTTSYLVGFTIGQGVAFGLLARATFQALPPEESEGGRLLPAFREYWMLAASAGAYHAAMWVDKVSIWAVAGGKVAAQFMTATTFSWFTVLPAFAWIWVQVETDFYEKYREFYDLVEGGAPLGQLRDGARKVALEARRVVLGAALIQFGVSGLAFVGGSMLVKSFAIAAGVATLRWLLVAAAMQAITVLGLLLLAYFDRRREALQVSIVFLIVNEFLPPIVLKAGGNPAVGTAIASLCAASLAVWRVSRRMETLLVDTFQGQPYSS